jgi:tetratricopeptide (TPR) repeat protein
MFRTRQYAEAMSAFRVAASIADRAPESYLSLMHTDFASGHFYMATGNLQLALKYFPQLPLVKLRVRGFFSGPEEFVRLLEPLEKKSQGRGVEADTWLLLAYFRYFDGAEAKAAEALRAAMKALPRQAAGEVRSTDLDATEEAIKTFWDGMVAAGKVSGSLTTQPAESPPTTRPAAAGPEKAHPRSTTPTRTGGGPEAGASWPSGPGG